MYIDLSGQVVLLTGATSGIGRCIVERLAEAGATVALHYSQNQSQAEQLRSLSGNQADIFQADLTDSEQVENLYHQVVKQYGRLDALVNNAGIYLYSPNQESQSEWLSKWHQTMAVNLTAAALLCKSALPQFIKQGNGRIVNMASRAAFRGDTADHLAYAASKGGLVSLTRTLARGYGKQNIKAFAIAPGFVRTAMANDFIAANGEVAITSELALNEMTEPEDVAPTVAFLLSGLLDHMTGNVIDLNAGSYVR